MTYQVIPFFSVFRTRIGPLKVIPWLTPGRGGHGHGPEGGECFGERGDSRRIGPVVVRDKDFKRLIGPGRAGHEGDGGNYENGGQ
jgi:hypothetical protein